MSNQISALAVACAVLICGASGARAAQGWGDPRTAPLSVRSLAIPVQASSKRMEPLAVWQNNGQFAIIDRQGSVIARENFTQFGALPLVVGQGADRAAAEFLGVLQNYPHVMERVQASVRVGDRRWNLRLVNGLDVLLPEGSAESGINRLSTAQYSDGIMDWGELATLDLREPTRIVLVQKAAAGAQGSSSVFVPRGTPSPPPQAALPAPVQGQPSLQELQQGLLQRERDNREISAAAERTDRTALAHLEKSVRSLGREGVQFSREGVQQGYRMAAVAAALIGYGESRLDFVSPGTIGVLSFTESPRRWGYVSPAGTLRTVIVMATLDWKGGSTPCGVILTVGEQSRRIDCALFDRSEAEVTDMLRAALRTALSPAR